MFTYRNLFTIALCAIFVATVISVDTALAAPPVGMTITDITINGDRNVTVGTDASASVSITGALSGPGDQWASTQYSIGTMTPSSFLCYDHEPDFGTVGSHTVTFPVAIPGTAGNYSLYAIMRKNGNCLGTPSDMVSLSGTITVITDQAPIITVTGDNPVTIPVLTGSYTEYGATAIDDIDGTVPVVVTGSVDINTVGDYSITYTATDSAEHTATAIRTVSVVDTVAPVITLNGNTSESVITGDAYNDPGATAHDAYDGDVSVTVSGSVNTEIAGTYTLYYDAVDIAGNQATQVIRTVSVSDANAPVFSLFDIITEATGSNGANVDFAPIFAMDEIDGEISAECSPDSGSVFPLGITPVMCSATNSHNVVGSDSFSVTIVDTTAPDIYPPDTQTFEATGTMTMPTLVQATATDIVDDSVLITVDTTTFPLGTTTVTWTATDDSENSNTDTSDVVIIDTTAPVIAEHDDIQVRASSVSGTTVVYRAPVTSDIYDGSEDSVCSPASGSLFPIGMTTVTCTATDSNGNTAEPVTFSVVVTAMGIPVITLNGGQMIYIPVGSVFTDPGATVSDTDEEGEIIASVSGSVNTAVVGRYTLTYTAVDSDENSAEPVTRIIEVYTPKGEGEGEGEPPQPENPTRNTRGSSSGFIPVVAELPQSAEPVPPTSCPVVSGYYDIGNRGDGVRDIQNYLNTYQGESLVVDGVYRLTTFEAVKRFQAKYAEQILEPWGITEPTGFWYLLTHKHANKLVGCDTPPVTLDDGTVIE